jgi:hypothetical protein
MEKKQPDPEPTQSKFRLEYRSSITTKNPLTHPEEFQPQLNFIEQCWGYAKRIYRLNPESSREDVLERNALAALESIPLESMRRFSIRSHRFMDAYSRGLNGRQAAWAARKYRGHRILPATIMDELEKAQVT